MFRSSAVPPGAAGARLEKQSPAGAAADGAQQRLHGRDFSTAAGRRQDPPTPRPRLDRDQLASLRRSLRGCQRALGLIHGAEHEAARQTLMDTIEDLAGLARGRV